MKKTRLACLWMLAWLLVGCAAPRVAPPPAKPTVQPPPVQSQTPPMPYPPVPPEPAPTKPAEPVTRPSAAVLALLDKSRSQSAAGRLEEAGASLERALRIDPRNPVLWHELARIRLAQGQYRQAENLAAKSNTLAGADRSLRAGNWRLIGRARIELGDTEAATDAFEKARQQ